MCTEEFKSFDILKLVNILWATCIFMGLGGFIILRCLL